MIAPHAAWITRIDDLSSPEVQELIAEHLRGMYNTSPAESVHALSIEALQQPEVTFWTIWDGDALCGCGALKELSPGAGEVKSMRTQVGWLRRGVGQHMLDVILETARQRGYREVLLETGTGDAFEPALSLYRKNGFAPCRAFGEYKATHFNVFMVKKLQAAGPAA
jgi:putative acetyltransferase